MDSKKFEELYLYYRYMRYIPEIRELIKTSIRLYGVIILPDVVNGFLENNPKCRKQDVLQITRILSI